MDLLTQILNCKSNEEVDAIIGKVIEKINSSVQPIEQLGFLDYGKNISYYKGFIPLNTRIKYANINIETYGMESTDFFYEFAYFVRKYGIKSISSLIYSAEMFCNQYFGYPGKCKREEVFYDRAFNTTTTDEELFAALKNNKIGDLKGKGAAECTEYGALVQQLLSLFGLEVYYCIGCLDRKNKQECHCFNIAKSQNGYVLLDYSIPVTAYNNDGSFKVFLPFIGELSNEEFLDFINKGIVKGFNNYQYIGNERQVLNSRREYVVGAFTIEKEKKL